ncbi:MAG: hypothetical protein A2113_00360 [Candidatus Woykebacteria bacterium GWA1_44_8]|uniref:Uncharacterized protein n=1 Tax=Candidatus Woykebacteria bacterium GWA1_44_8 TaxID=1802591 RepID=A0A1G1W1P1_9BACT|nr:MAG: hypothetical protein A2113_00360 [Candidatus Woykebacteria bacterium GWA1_44_8]
MNLFLQTTLSFGQSSVFNQGDDFFQTAMKWMLIACFALYVAFAFVVTRQIKIMRNTLITPFSPVLTTLGYVHLGAAFLCLVFFTLFL